MIKTLKVVDEDFVSDINDELEEINESILKQKEHLKRLAATTDPARKIIETEMLKLYKQVVEDSLSLDKDDTVKFEKLVKCFVALETGKTNPEDKKLKGKPEDILKRVLGR